MCWRHSKPCTIEPDAIGQHAVVNTMPRWKGHQQVSRNSRNLRHSKDRKNTHYETQLRHYCQRNMTVRFVSRIDGTDCGAPNVRN